MQNREPRTENHAKPPFRLSGTTAGPLRALMQGFVDYAGLFPPAGLALRRAAATYAAHRAGPHAWMLGRLIVPFEQLDALAARFPTAPLSTPWRISAVIKRDPSAAIAAITARDGRYGVGLLVDTVELHADSVEAIIAIAGAVPNWLTTYVEIPLEPEPRGLVEAIAACGLRAKARTGGITTQAIPSPASLARFLAVCTRAEVPFKATAGLHHLLRGVYPLTYEVGSPHAPMFGFLNLLLATVALRDGADETTAAALLEANDPACVRVGQEALCWRELRWPVEALRATRYAGLVAIGSCSFHEPVEELLALCGAP